MEFFKKFEVSFNMEFTDQNAASMIISEGSIYSMLLTEKVFKGFTKNISYRQYSVVTILEVFKDELSLNCLLVSANINRLFKRI